MTTDHTPPTEQGALRDRIAEALANADGLELGETESFPFLHEGQVSGYRRRADAVLAVLPPPVSRAAKAEALLLRFTAEAHRRKWNYDRGLDDDGVPIKSEAFDALHRLGEEMRVELEKLRRMADEAQPGTEAPADVEHCVHDRAIHQHHHHTPVDGCPWCAASVEARS